MQPNIITAINAINPEAKFTMPEGVIEWLDGTAEISQADIDAKLTELTAAYEAEEAAKVAAKAAGNQKLLDLGLTQEEATALTGYTPPAE